MKNLIASLVLVLAASVRADSMVLQTKIGGNQTLTRVAGEADGKAGQYFAAELRSGGRLSFGGELGVLTRGERVSTTLLPGFTTTVSGSTLLFLATSRYSFGGAYVGLGAGLAHSSVLATIPGLVVVDSAASAPAFMLKAGYEHAFDRLLLGVEAGYMRTGSTTYSTVGGGSISGTQAAATVAATVGYRWGSDGR